MSDTPIRVLIVDDELPLRQELRSLPWASFDAEFVGEAENGEEALELCEKLQPDLVITDITMPIMNGMELFRAIKQKWPFMQVVLLTCHSDFHYAQEALRLGALDYFTKLALEEGDLQASIDKTRASQRREQDLQRYGQEQLRRELSKQIATLSHGEAAPLTELLSAGLRELGQGTAEPARRMRKEVQLARRIIEQKLGEPLTLTSVSEEVGLSSYYLSRLFKEETGEAFNDYITRLRMEKAVHLLQTTPLKVYEVAEQVGIPSYRYFSQLFRNWTGVAPTEFKKG